MKFKNGDRFIVNINYLDDIDTDGDTIKVTKITENYIEYINEKNGKKHDFGDKSIFAEICLIPIPNTINPNFINYVKKEVELNTK